MALRITRGLFRLWLVFSLAWIVGCLWILDFSCFFKFTSGPWCDYWIVYPLTSSTYVKYLAVTFGVPLGALVLGSALVWAFRGFR
jgi:hypothetical protein